MFDYGSFDPNLALEALSMDWQSLVNVVINLFKPVIIQINFLLAQGIEGFSKNSQRKGISGFVFQDQTRAVNSLMIEGATPSRNTNSTAGIKDTICPSTKSR
jgi:hypothetical protein